MYSNLYLSISLCFSISRYVSLSLCLSVLSMSMYLNHTHTHTHTHTFCLSISPAFYRYIISLSLSLCPSVDLFMYYNPPLSLCLPSILSHFLCLSISIITFSSLTHSLLHFYPKVSFNFSLFFLKFLNFSSVSFFFLIFFSCAEIEF